MPRQDRAIAKKAVKQALGSSTSVSSGSQSHAKSFLAIAMNQAKSMQDKGDDDSSNASMSTTSTSRREISITRPPLKDADSSVKSAWCKEIENVFLEYKANNINPSLTKWNV